MPKPASEFLDLRIVEQHLDAAARDVAERAGRGFHQAVSGSLRHIPSLQFDSPLEVLFWIWWEAGVFFGPFNFSDELSLSTQCEVVVRGQLYRVDFLIEPTRPELAGSRDWTPIAVEVDGHGFHERTPEQVAWRDRRDRALQAAGWRVFHFSFSEFTRDPAGCVAEVFIYAREQWNRVSMRYHLERATNARGSVHPPTTRPLGESQPVDGSGVSSVDPVPTLG